MNILSELKDRFREPLSHLVDNPDDYLKMIRQTKNPKHGDYQATFAMPLAKRLGRSPQDIAAEIVNMVDVSDFCRIYVC